MFRISEKTLDKLREASNAVSELFDELEVERELFEGKARRLIEQIDEAKEEARALMDDEALSAESYYDERSEKWQEGDRGQAYGEWKDRLREVAESIAEDIEAPEVPDIDRPHWMDELRDPDFAEFEA